MEIKLSKNFTFDEFVKTSHTELSEKNYEYGVANINKLKVLADLLQQVRDLLKCPVMITSGVRCPELNKKVGGAETSQHMRCEAADIKPDGITTEDAFGMIIKSDIEFDQIILEQPSANNVWIHISRADKPRHDILYWNGKKYIKYEVQDV